jgi:hypothetical protein
MEGGQVFRAMTVQIRRTTNMERPVNLRGSDAPRRRRLAASLAVVLLAFANFAVAQTAPPTMPMQAKYEDGAEYRWLNKPVLASRALDGMEDLSSWTFTGTGEMKLSDDYAKEGKHSIRISSTRNEGTVGNTGEWQDLVATRKFDNDDWRPYNRISIWIYADVVGAPAISCSLTLHNDGAHKLPDHYNEGRHEALNLRNHAWNHLVWEIEPLDRDKVTAIDVAYSMPKMFPDPGDHTVLYIDKLDLEKVVPDHVEGWDMAPGKIAFSNSGYSTGATKSAIAHGLGAHEFSVVDTQTGEVMLTRAIENRTTSLGEYQLLDFSVLRQPGSYLLRAGEVATRAFRIGDDAWRDSIWKAVNFMYSERCGTVIPGIHGICHQDDYGTHDGKMIPVNGGYHDAGDLSATGNTPGMAYALFSLAERLRQQGTDPVLAERLVEEGEWGLNWVLKTRFGSGFRTTGTLISYWTNGILGDADDRHSEAVNDAEWNFRVAAVEALAARVLKDRDPALASRSLATAQDDWKYAVDGLRSVKLSTGVYGMPDELERVSYGVVASVELYKATGDAEYANEAKALGDLVLASQERKLQPWSIPLTGFFYTGPARENLFHRFHNGQEQEPIVALVRLCEAFPEDEKWMQWYSATVLHSKYYLSAAAQVDAPYDMLPASVYREGEAKLLPESKNWTPLRAADRDAFVQEVKQGVPLGGDAYLRRFPVWFDFRGNFSVLLSEAKALSAASRLRGDLDGEDLAEEQAEWIVGRNPFAQSVMYGEGYDWTPLYSMRSGQMVGALPVGIETKGYADAPYWPAQVCWTYKEVWTQPVGQWVWLMEDIYGPSLVEGIGDPARTEPVELREQKTGQVETANYSPMDGSFRATVPAGHYDVRQGKTHTTITVLPGGVHRVDLRSASAFEFRVTANRVGKDEAVIRVTAEGAGEHSFELRTNNLDVSQKLDARLKLAPDREQTVEWHGRIASADTPWVAVVVPDHSLADRREVSAIRLLDR